MKRLLMLIVLLILAAVCVVVANHGTSSVDKAASITFQAATKMDSARASFYYPTMATRIDSVKLIPATVASGVNDSTVLVAAISAGALTEIGVYVVKIALWEQGASAVSRYSIGTWNHTEMVDTISTTAADVGTLNDSILPAIQDGASGKDNFKADTSGLARPADLDSVNQAIADANKDNFKADTSGLARFTDLDSVLTAIADANKDNFKADTSGLARPADLDSVNQAIADANKSNFMATVTTPTDVNQSGDTIMRLKDSLVNQGPGGSLTAQEVAGYVEDTLSTEHGAGSWQGTGIGSGPNDLTIFAIDSVTDDTLTGVGIYIRNETGTPEASGVTDTEGVATVKLAVGTWIIQAGENITQYAFDDTVYTVSVAFDTTAILGYPIVIPSPANPDLATVFGWLYDFMGTPVQNVIVTMQLETSLNVTSTGSGFTIGQNIGYDTSDVTGYFSFPAIRSTIYDDSLKSLYHVVGKLGRYPRFTVDSIYVPATGNVDITDEINN